MFYTFTVTFHIALLLKHLCALALPQLLSVYQLVLFFSIYLFQYIPL